MVDQKPKNSLNAKQYSRLKAEMATPYRGLRQLVYVGFGASGFIGAFVFFFRLLAGREVESTLPNLALQLGVVALMVFLWRWDRSKDIDKT
ncbi:hypothetical protein NIES4074_15380 [Cylindrospermum sp. NIES-4074]|nr:hypothetical protein NIES4074_15380 [Cylindrospermum sp. NIES-4074]